MMVVNVLFFASHRRAAGTAASTLELNEGSTVRDAAALLEARHGLTLRGSMVAVNDEYATPETRLRAGDTLALIPPVSGGTHDDHFEVSAQPLEIARLHARLVHPGLGGQAVFTGSTRTPNQGLEIVHLEYEVYDALCYTVMQQLAQEVKAQFDVHRVVLAHRSGIVNPGEVSIFVGASSAHRRAALDAVPWLVDAAKARLPVWKLEVAANGERWVEGNAGAAVL
jgi:molybdopterin synthase catalytic subunit